MAKSLSRNEVPPVAWKTPRKTRAIAGRKFMATSLVHKLVSLALFPAPGIYWTLTATLSPMSRAWRIGDLVKSFVPIMLTDAVHRSSCYTTDRFCNWIHRVEIAKRIGRVVCRPDKIQNINLFLFEKIIKNVQESIRANITRSCVNYC